MIQRTRFPMPEDHARPPAAWDGGRGLASTIGVGSPAWTIAAAILGLLELLVFVANLAGEFPFWVPIVALIGAFYYLVWRVTAE